MIRNEQSIKNIKERLFARPGFDIDQAFRSLDQSFTGSVSHSDVSVFAKYLIRGFAQIKYLMVKYGLVAAPNPKICP